MINAEVKIDQLVNVNHLYASVLFYLGISFYDYSDETLSQVCEEHGLDTAQVIQKLESFGGVNTTIPDSVFQLPVDLIVEFLKQSHHDFVKKRLPYICQLIDHLDPRSVSHPAVAEDLKFIFPMFVEDFIHHIYEEEDTLFDYINQLTVFQRNKQNAKLMLMRIQKNELQAYALHHEDHGDEMAGIRKITRGYSLENPDTHLKVLLMELKTFEKELLNHARIENEVLFPKALMLERRIKQKLSDLIHLN